MHVKELFRILANGVVLSAQDITDLKACALPSALSSYAVLKQTAISGAARLAKITFGNNQTGTTQYPTIAVTDDGSTGHASQELLDFPAGVIAIDACYTNLSFTTTAAWAPTTPVVSIGSAAAGTNATLTTTEADVVPSTALTIAAGASTALTKSTARAIAQLTDTLGTGDGTIADATSSFSQTVLNNNFQDISTEINTILAANAGLVPLVFDGTSSALKLYLNFACNSDPTTGKTIIPAGDIWCWWRLLTP